MDANTPEKFEIWGVLEVMGHLRLAGHICVEPLAGASFFRIDIPNADGGYNTRWFGGSSIYAITPTDEATARVVAAHHRPAPVQPYELLPPGRAQTVGAADTDDWAVDRDL